MAHHVNSADGSMNHALPVQQLRSGDLKAFRSVFIYCYPAIRYFARRLTGSAKASEGIVEGIFTRLWQNRVTFTDVTAIKTFLYINTYQQCFQFIKALNDPALLMEWEEVWMDRETAVLREMVRAELLLMAGKDAAQLPALLRKFAVPGNIAGSA